MTFTELREKIEHARSLGHDVLPALPVRDFPQLIRRRMPSHQPYLIYTDGDDNRIELSYNEFCGKVYEVARFLQHRGLRNGDHIATVSHNHWHTVIQYFAAWLLGLVVVPVSLAEDDERIAFILEKGMIELAFIRIDYRDRLSAIIKRYDQLKNIEMILCEESPDNYCKKEGQLKLAEESLAESEALIVFTSGTTGTPKGVVLSQRNLLEDARSIAGWHGISTETRMMCVLPIHHVNGTVVTLVTPFFTGGSTVLNRKFRVERFFPVIEEEGVHIVSVVPTILQFLNAFYDGKRDPGSAVLRHIICGAGPLTVHTAETFEGMFDIPIIHGYGLSETTCYSCFVPVGMGRAEHGKWRSGYGYPSIGVPIPANEMGIHDSGGNPLGEHERGEIVIRGVNVMMGYHNNRKANEDAFRHGWFRSGDEGFYINDEKGRPYFFITGRLKELIIRGGVNMAPLEIDEVISQAPGVKAGIAVGFENIWYGEEVGAFVQLEEGWKQDESAILEHCRTCLPFSMAPKVVVFGDEIPVTSTGKYQRHKLAPLFEGWRGVQFREAPKSRNKQKVE